MHYDYGFPAKEEGKTIMGRYCGMGTKIELNKEYLLKTIFKFFPCWKN